MKIDILYVVKYIKWLYQLYYYAGSFFLNVLRLFIKPDDNMILFISFGGRKFDDSPKAIYDQMISDVRFDNYKIVWAFRNPEKFNLPKGEKVKCDTFQYFLIALKARIWITNSSVERGLSFKGRNTFCFNTWHGTPIKKMGTDINDKNLSFKSKAKWNVDYFTCQGEYEKEIYCRVFSGLKKDNAHVIGLPRNDIYANYTEEYMLKLKNKLNIPDNKRVILYAPTYREFDKTVSMGVELSLPVQFEKWRETLGDNYIVLFRAHYEVSEKLNIKNDDFIMDMSNYPQLEDLMIVSDILISDYSSIFFDYSIMHKPMIAFCYDYNRYTSERGLYFDIRRWLPSAENEDELLKLINKDNLVDYIKKTQEFQQSYVTSYGLATNKSLDVIYKELSLNINLNA